MSSTTQPSAPASAPLRELKVVLGELEIANARHANAVKEVQESSRLQAALTDEIRARLEAGESTQSDLDDLLFLATPWEFGLRKELCLALAASLKGKKGEQVLAVQTTINHHSSDVKYLVDDVRPIGFDDVSINLFLFRLDEEELAFDRRDLRIVFQTEGVAKYLDAHCGSVADFAPGPFRLEPKMLRGGETDEERSMWRTLAPMFELPNDREWVTIIPGNGAVWAWFEESHGGMFAKLHELLARAIGVSVQHPKRG